MRTRPTGTLFAREHLAECRRLLEAAARCPGTGAPLAEGVLVTAGRATCPVCAQPTSIVPTDSGEHELAAHDRPEVRL